MKLDLFVLWVIYLIRSVMSLPIDSDLNSKIEFDEQKLIEFLKNEFEKEASEILCKVAVADYELHVDNNNVTKRNALAKQSLISAKFRKNIWEKHFKEIDLDKIRNPSLKRQLYFLLKIFPFVSNEEKQTQVSIIEDRLLHYYNVAKICPYKQQNCNLSKDGLSIKSGISTYLTNDYDELEYMWNSWKNELGTEMREDYKQFVNLSNKAAKLNVFSDYWSLYYESKSFMDEIDELWIDIKPLYDELHTFMLNRLKYVYPQLKEQNDNLIPAHIFAVLLEENWTRFYKLLQPFPVNKTDVTDELLKQGYTPKNMFELVDVFYRSLGLEPNDICFNTSAGAVIEKPPDREIDCHPQAWDFFDGKNYRVSMCADVSHEDLQIIFHEMGHIQYFLLYKNQPYIFRHVVNPGIHEAVGDTLALSFFTTEHLQKIGLIKSDEETEESSINALMYTALETVAALPFMYLLDKWRLDVFSGNVSESEWNKRWWYYKEKIQKIKAPNVRTEEYFDPDAVLYVPDAGMPYIQYFVASVLQFQFHEALCTVAKQYDPNNPSSKPLHKCNIYKSKEAGSKLRAGLSLGGSRRWTEVLEVITGTKKPSGKALLKYFQPLFNYIKKENEKLIPATDHTIPIVGIGILVIIVVLFFFWENVSVRMILYKEI